MAKGISFDSAFIASQALKRTNWKKAGRRAGHGGEYDVSFGGYECSSSVMGSDSIGFASNRHKRHDLVSGNKHLDIPLWLVDIIKSDNEVARAISTKVFKPESPHKRALVELSKDIELMTGRKATSSTKARRANVEHYIQVRIFYMLERYYPDIYNVTKSVPNGGLRHEKTGRDLKAEGQKDGSPDIDLEYPRGAYHGMKLEVKSEVGIVSDSQHEKILAYNQLNFYAVYAKGFDACWEKIINYIELPEFDNITRLASI